MFECAGGLGHAGLALVAADWLGGRSALPGAPGDLPPAGGGGMPALAPGHCHRGTGGGAARGAGGLTGPLLTVSISGWDAPKRSVFFVRITAVWELVWSC